MQPTDKEILSALRPLYASDRAAEMGAQDDLRTARRLFSVFKIGQTDMQQLHEQIAQVLREGLSLEVANKSNYIDCNTGYRNEQEITLKFNDTVLSTVYIE